MMQVSCTAAAILKMYFFNDIQLYAKKPIRDEHSNVMSISDFQK